MDRVLVVEDDLSIAEPLLYALETDGFGVEHSALGADALTRVSAGGVDLVILDVGLPDRNGFDVCRELRRSHDVPVIFLTARGEEVDRIVGLEIGGDDYVVKPFSPREVVARVRSVLRRTGSTASDDSPRSAEDRGGHMHLHGEPLDLTRYEYRIMTALLEADGAVLSRDELMQAAWEHPGVSSERTVDTHIKQLRAKLRETCPEEHIRTHRGRGYSWCEHGEPAR